jgi:hypothetical protein
MQQFEASQAVASRDYMRRSRRIVLANLIALLSQTLFIYDVYQGKAANPPQLPSGMEPAARFVFIYTLCGILGSAIALVAVLILSAVLWSQV